MLDKTSMSYRVSLAKCYGLNLEVDLKTAMLAVRVRMSNILEDVSCYHQFFDLYKEWRHGCLTHIPVVIKRVSLWEALVGANMTTLTRAKPPNRGLSITYFKVANEQGFL